jgi:hypothetical protein
MQERYLMINEALQSEYFLNWLQSSTRLLHYGTIRGMEKREPPTDTWAPCQRQSCSSAGGEISCCFYVSVWGA